MEWEWRVSLPQQYIPWTGTRVPWKVEQLGAGVSNCGAIPGWRLLFTAERWIEGMWRRLWREMPVEQRQAAREARRYCWVTHRGWSHHHSLSLPTGQHPCWTVERLAHQKPDPLNYRAAPHPGCSLKWLIPRTTEEDPTKSAPSIPWYAI